MEGRFAMGNAAKFAGPSLCGKTTALRTLLKSKNYFSPCPPKRVMWVSGSDRIDEKLEKEIMQLYPDSQFFYGSPDCRSLRKMVEQHDAWVFDDLAGELANDTEFTAFFTKTCHHADCIMFYLSQNPFERSGQAVTRTRNCPYQLFWPNNADVRWISSIGQQLLGNAPLFEKMFHHVITENYDCLLCDNRATTKKEDGQFIGYPFNNEKHPVCYLVPHK